MTYLTAYDIWYEPIDHRPSSQLTIKPIDHWAYRSSSLSTIEPINHQADRPSCLSTFETIDLWSSFATFKPFGLFYFENLFYISNKVSHFLVTLIQIISIFPRSVLWTFIVAFKLTLCCYEHPIAIARLLFTVSEYKDISATEQR